MNNPKIQAILDIINSEADLAGNSYYAFRYTRCQDGKQTMGKITGGRHNISYIRGMPGLCPIENVYYTYHTLSRSLFKNLTSDWNYAGCSPQDIAQFIVEGLATPLYERPMLAYDRVNKRYAVLDQFTMLVEYTPGTQEEALAAARKYFGRTISFETVSPNVKMRIR